MSGIDPNVIVPAPGDVVPSTFAGVEPDAGVTFSGSAGVELVYVTGSATRVNVNE
jgi:hypothetical protein